MAKRKAARSARSEPAKPAPRFETREAAAKEIPCTPQCLTYYWKQGKIPLEAKVGEGKDARWNMNLVLQARDAGNLKGSPKSLTQQRIKAKREYQQYLQDKAKTRKVLRDEQVEVRNLLPRDEYAIFANETIAEARDAFLNLPTEMRKHLPKKHADDIVVELTKQITTVLNRLAKLEGGPAPNDK